MRRSVGGTNSRLLTGALRGGLALKGWQMVCFVAQAEHPAGPHTGQNNLPTALVRDPYARWCGRTGVERLPLSRLTISSANRALSGPAQNLSIRS